MGWEHGVLPLWELLLVKRFVLGLGYVYWILMSLRVFRCDSGGLEIDERGFWRFELDGLLEIFPVLILH